FGDDIRPETAPPFRLADSEESLLDGADLVFFDPPGTGFSRILPDGKPEQHYGVAHDARATVGLTRSWVPEHGRCPSPRPRVGAGRMDGITLNGVILLGQAMDMRGAGRDLRYVNSLPSLAATAWYHGRVDREGTSLTAHVEAARRFAAREYRDALFAGWDLDE